MALNIKDEETEALVTRITSLTGETETEAVREAARERLERLEPKRKRKKKTAEEWNRAMDRVRLGLPEENRGRTITKAEREEFLGYGPGGV